MIVGHVGDYFFDRRGRRLVIMACYMGSRQYVPLITISGNFILVCSGGVEWFKHKQLASSESWSQIGIQRTSEWSQIRTGAEKKRFPSRNTVWRLCETTSNAIPSMRRSTILPNMAGVSTMRNWRLVLGHDFGIRGRENLCQAAPRCQ